MDINGILKECQQRMDKSAEYLDSELRGIRTGGAATARIDDVKGDYVGRLLDLKDLAAISVPEPTQLLIKPFDPQSVSEIAKAIENASLGLNPQQDSGQIRINVPPPSAERRQQLVAQVKKMGEEARIAVRNERRDAIKQIDALVKDKANAISEDDGKGAREEIESITKKHIENIDAHVEKKAKEIQAI